MDITANGITLRVGDADLVEMMRYYLFRGDYPATIRLAAAPRIGELWPGQGGWYAGMVRGEQGKADYPLVLLESVEKSGPWEEMMKWAAGAKIDGRQDGRLPTRREQALLSANLPEHFKKEWYWSCEQRASDPSYAWVQGFSYGGQDYGLKGNHYRARAVRQVLVIESLSQ